MKKIILLVVLAASQLIIFAQTVNIHFKNGQIIEFPSDNVEFVDFSEKASNPSLTAGQAVDLGLSVYWASCNIGAEKPEDSGNYYAWGETAPKTKFTLSNYAYYNSDTQQFIEIGSNICGTQYDAATVNLGSDWRLPTKEEMKELIDNCTWEWVQLNGINGYRIIGKNNNSIFLPNYSTNRDFYYWTGTNCICLWGQSDYYNITSGGSYSYRGFSIRPVTTNPNAGSSATDHSKDHHVTEKISASFIGGAYSSINGTIQSGSQLSWRFSNKSSESVTLTGIQLINGSTNSESSNLLTESVNVLPGESKGYTTTVGIFGIQKPKIRFTYLYNQNSYTVEASMPD